MWNAYGEFEIPCLEPVLITTLGFSWCNIDCTGRGQGHTKGVVFLNERRRWMEDPPPIEMRGRFSAPGSIVTKRGRFVVLPVRTRAERSEPWIKEQAL